MSLPEAHLMQFTTFGNTLPDFPSRSRRLGLGFILHWSIPLDKLFQAEVRLTPRRLSGVYFQASEPGVISAFRTATGYNIKLCSGRTLKDPGASYEVLGGGGADSRGLSITAHSLTAQRGELMALPCYLLSSVHHVRRPLYWHDHIEVKVRLPHKAHHDLANLGPQWSSPTVNVSALCGGIPKRLHASHITKRERT